MEANRPIALYILILLSPLITLVTLLGWSLSDQHNTFDFLTPVIGIAQLVFIGGMFSGKLWGLAGFSVVVAGLILATFLYYLPKAETDAALRTALVLSPLLLLSAKYWFFNRSYFK